MIDFKDLENNLDKYQTALDKRGERYDLKDALKIHGKHNVLMQKVENVRAQQNVAAREQDKGKGSKLKAEVAKLEKELATLQTELMEVAEGIPNIPLDDVPAGGEDDSRVVARVGEPVKIKKPKDHIELGVALNILDIERGVKTSGSRFYFLKNQAVELEFAIIRWVFDLLKKKGFELVVPPVMVNERVMNAGGYLGKAKDEVYRIMDLRHNEFIDNVFGPCPNCGEKVLVSSTSDFAQFIDPKGNVGLFVQCPQCPDKGYFKALIGGLKHDLYLVGTSEQSMLGYHMDEIIDVPKRYAAFSTCFRKEAGSYGKDVKGIIRTHQFDKIEMFSYVEPKNSSKEHNELIKIQEEILEELEIPYKKVLLAAEDISICSARTMDLESWLPSQDRYRETHSCSNCTDWQARRANIRYKKHPKAITTGVLARFQTDYVHTLNGTAIAIGRMMVALWENHQQTDGSIKIPKALHPYLSFTEIK